MSRRRELRRGGRPDLPKAALFVVVGFLCGVVHSPETSSCGRAAASRRPHVPLSLWQSHSNSRRFGNRRCGTCAGHANEPTNAGGAAIRADVPLVARQRQPLQTKQLQLYARRARGGARRTAVTPVEARQQQEAIYTDTTCALFSSRYWHRSLPRSARAPTRARVPTPAS